MASDRMMQAIGTLERAISGLEQDVDALLRAAPSSSPSTPSSGMDVAAARAALRSLDELIEDMKGRADG